MVRGEGEEAGERRGLHAKCVHVRACESRKRHPKMQCKCTKAGSARALAQHVPAQPFGNNTWERGR